SCVDFSSYIPCWMWSRNWILLYSLDRIKRRGNSFFHSYMDRSCSEFRKSINGSLYFFFFSLYGEVVVVGNWDRSKGRDKNITWRRFWICNHVIWTLHDKWPTTRFKQFSFNLIGRGSFHIKCSEIHIFISIIYIKMQI